MTIIRVRFVHDTTVKKRLYRVQFADSLKVSTLNRNSKNWSAKRLLQLRRRAARSITIQQQKSALHIKKNWKKNHNTFELWIDDIIFELLISSHRFFMHRWLNNFYVNHLFGYSTIHWEVRDYKSFVFSLFLFLLFSFITFLHQRHFMKVESLPFVVAAAFIDDDFGRRKSMFILTRKNQKMWFRFMKIWLIDDGFWTNVTKLTFAFMISNFDVTKDVKAQYHFVICIDVENKKRTTNLITIKDIWTSLWKKYKNKLKIIDRQYIENWAVYKKFSEKSIEKTWIEISTLTRKIKKIHSNYEILISESFRIQFFLKSFFEKYFVVRDTLDVQGEENYEIVIRKLQKKKATFNRQVSDATKAAEITKETTMYVKFKYHHRRHFFSFDVSMLDALRNKDERRRVARSTRFRTCYICEFSKHIARTCFLRKKLKKFVKKQLIKEKKKRSKKNEKQKSKNHALTVENNHFENWISNFELNDFDEKKLAALSKKMISDISKNKWIADFDVFASITNNFELFNDSLKSIRRRVIKIEKERFYSNKSDLTRVQNKKKRIRLITVLYVSDLKMNFLSIKRLCEMRLEKSFDENDLYMRDKKERLMLKVFAFSGVYIVDKVTKELNEIALIAIMIGDVINAFIALSFTEIESKTELTDSNDVTLSKFETSDFQLEAVNAFKLKKYKFWHRRFVHMSKIKLKNFHKIITLKKFIFIVENLTFCKVCFTTKLINARSRVLTTRKLFILILIFIDICEKLSASWQDHRYFLKIVNNHSRKIWIILLKKRADAMKALRKWRLTIELKTEVRLLTVRNDNALKLKFILDEWKKFTNIETQYNEAHTFKQNEIFERDIRITKNNIRVMIKKRVCSLNSDRKRQRSMFTYEIASIQVQ